MLKGHGTLMLLVLTFQKGLPFRKDRCNELLEECHVLSTLFINIFQEISEQAARRMQSYDQNANKNERNCV